MINEEIWDAYVDEEVSAMREQMRDDNFWQQLDEDLESYEKNDKF